MKIGKASDALQFALPLQLGADGHGVGGVAASEQLDDDVVHGSVRRPVKVRGAENLDDVGDGVLRQHHAPQNGHLRIDVLRRDPLERRTALSPFAHNAHIGLAYR